MIKQFAQLCVHTNNIEETEKFYCDIVGFRRKFDFLMNGKLFGIYINPGINFSGILLL